MEAAITAAGHAGADRKQENDVLALKLEQARYEAARARRQYDAVEPENRLVAGELEQRWNRALKAVAEVERERVAFEAGESRKDEKTDRTALLQLAEDLPRVWHDPESGMRLKKRIVRTLIEEILVDVDEESARIHMIVRWADGQHARLSVRKKRKGQHRYTTDRKVVEIVRELAAMLPDGQIARVLNRLGLKTGRRQVVPYAPWTIRAADLQEPAVQEYVRRMHAGRNAPQTLDPEQLTIDSTST